jgi:kinetochore protein Mis12/MTW1
MPTDKGPESTAPTQLPSSLLLCEALGFAPQLLLDDIINIANNAVQDGVNGMEEFLIKWVEEREEKRKNAPPEPPAKGKKGKKQAKGARFVDAQGAHDLTEGFVAAEEEAEDLTQEVEQGLVAFQTLLEYHTDIAFDFFEAWSLRNIFYVPPELERGDVVVLPHYEGANLTGKEGETAVVDKQREMMDEIEELRKRLDEVRRLAFMLCSCTNIDASNDA